MMVNACETALIASVGVETCDSFMLHCALSVWHI
jgi:hypothetical protein